MEHWWARQNVQTWKLHISFVLEMVENSQQLYVRPLQNAMYCTVLSFLFPLHVYVHAHVGAHACASVSFPFFPFCRLALFYIALHLSVCLLPFIPLLCSLSVSIMCIPFTMC